MATVEKKVKVKLNLATLNPEFKPNDIKHWYLTNEDGSFALDESGNRIATSNDKSNLFASHILAVGEVIEVSEEIAKAWESEKYDLGLKSYTFEKVLENGEKIAVSAPPMGQLNPHQPSERHVISRATRI
jgi:hypothetical protein